MPLTNSQRIAAIQQQQDESPYPSWLLSRFAAGNAPPANSVGFGARREEFTPVPPVVRGTMEERFLNSRAASPAITKPAPAIPVNFTPSATRMGALSQKSLAALNPGRYNVSVGGSTYRNVSPEFARSAGLGAGRSDTLTEVPKATQILSPANPQVSNEGQRLLAQANQVNAERNAAYQPPVSAVNMTDNEKMTRYGTRFPDQLPISPSFRDFQNARDFYIRSRIPQTSNQNVGAGSAAASGVY